jgi:hypothetical protein
VRERERERERQTDRQRREDREGKRAGRGRREKERGEKNFLEHIYKNWVNIERVNLGDNPSDSILVGLTANLSSVFLPESRISI